MRAVLVLAYRDTDQRRRLLAEGLVRLDDHGARRWQFADLQPGLVELVVDGAAETDLARWLTTVLDAGWAERAAAAEAPFTLAPHLFPGGRPPARYEDLNARASVRACRLARHGDPADAGVCGAEVAALHRSLAEDPARTVRWHLQWLGESLPNDPPGAAPPSLGSIPHAAPFCTDAERAELDADAATLDRGEPEVLFGGRVADATTARLAHVQFVRLRAVEDRVTEAALLRRLLGVRGLGRPG